MLQLSGTNIVLREFSDANLHDKNYFAWLRDLEVMGPINRLEYLLPIKFDEVVKYVENVRSSPHDAFFAIYSKAEDEFIGTLRLSEIDWRAGIANVGILIGDKSYWGKGISKDVISVATEYAFTTLGLRRLVASCLSTNVAMSKCFERLGYKLEGVQRGQSFIGGEYIDRDLFGLFRDEFRPYGS